MTSQKQIEANRRNALFSTGPRTEEGKQQSRQNAFKHGMTAETVIVGTEDAAAYAVFEQEIFAENDPQTALERELVLRITSLLWRLRRASLIETGLLALYCKASANAGRDPNEERASYLKLLESNVRLLAAHASAHAELAHERVDGSERQDSEGQCESGSDIEQRTTVQKRLTQSFLRLINVPTSPLERITRYEAALWRQFVQTVFALDAAKRQQFLPSRYRFRPYPPQW